MAHGHESASEQAARREEICRVGRWMCEKNYVGGRDGNISVRLSDGRIMCTPTDVSKGAMTAGQIALLDVSGRQIAGDRPVTSEVRLHLRVYADCRDVNAIVHAHPPCATAFAVAGQAPPAGVQPEVELSLGAIALAPYQTPGTDAVADGVAEAVAGGARAVIMANHGAVAVAGDLRQAWWRMDVLERYCHVVLLSLPLGGPRPLSSAHLAELRGSVGSPRA